MKKFLFAEMRVGVGAFVAAGSLFLLVLGGAPAPVPAAEWIEAAKLLASDRDGRANFGFGAAINGDYIAVGAIYEPPSGAVYIFERNATARWTEVAKLTASDADGRWLLGLKVSIWGDIVAATAPDADPDDLGAVYVFERDAGGVWQETAKLIAPDGSNFGSSVAVWGDTIVVGTELESIRSSPDTGAAYVFERDAGGPGKWGLVAKLKASDGVGNARFGVEVALEGDRLVVGARNDREKGEGSGSAYIFERQAGGEWIEVRKLTASDGDLSDSFGKSVGVSGKAIVVGAERDEVGEEFEAGSAYVFELEAGGEWIEVRRLTAADADNSDWFGGSVGIDGDIVVVGAERHDGPESFSGAAYVFERDQGGPNMWGQMAKLIASDTDKHDSFGKSVGVSGQQIVAGSPDDDVGGSASVFLRVDGCELDLALERSRLRAGEELRVGVDLHHRRPITVTVPFLLWIEDAAGQVVAQKSSPPITMEPEDHRHLRMAVTLPPGMLPGTYRVLVGVRRMQQGIAWGSQQFEIVE